MAVSKPMYKLMGKYFEQLFEHPLRTKAISCCLIACAGNLASQYISGSKSINLDSILAFGTYGLFFGGPLPHFFYGFLERAINEDATFAVLKKLIVERLIYLPLYHALTLYMLARLEGKSHDAAVKSMKALYRPILLDNWKYLTLIQYLNLQYVPPMLRVLIVNITGFFWTIYFVYKRKERQAKEE